MVPVFRLLAGWTAEAGNWRLGWYLGLMVYWLVWGAAFPLLMIGLLVSTNFGNGFFEEILWRGLFMELFPTRILFCIVWPSVWFGLAHYAPGSVAPNGNPVGLMIGAGMMGFYLSFLAQKTGTIWWGIIAHALGGFIMIV